MCSAMGIEYRGKWKSENGKWTSGTDMLGSLVTGSSYVRTSTTRRSSQNRLESMDFGFSSDLLRDVRME